MLWALGFDRVRHRKTEGLEFLRVLGTGAGSSTAPGTQWGRTALFCLFADDRTADGFIYQLRQQSGLLESWHVKMRGAGGHGSWRGCAVPSLLNVDGSSDSETRGPVAMITRAEVNLRSWRAFAREARVVDHELHQSSGLLAVVGVGEAPILRLGTFSLWRDRPALIDFARRRPEHQRVVMRTRAERWYGEEMFARFVPYWSVGTWDGHDPLAHDPS